MEYSAVSGVGASMFGLPSSGMDEKNLQPGLLYRYDFEALEAEATKLNAHIQGMGTNPPHLMKGLDELGQAYRLPSHSGIPSSRRGFGINENIFDEDSSVYKQKGIQLLAQKNFDTGAATRDLASLNLQPDYKPGEPLGPVNLEDYLEHHHSMIISTTVEEARIGAQERARERHRHRAVDLWEKDKCRLMDKMGAKMGQWNVPYQTQPAEIQAIGAFRELSISAMPGVSAHAEERSAKPSNMTLVMRKYAELVQRLNQPLLQQGQLALMQAQPMPTSSAINPVAEFMQLVKSLEGPGLRENLDRHVYSGYSDCWCILGPIVAQQNTPAAFSSEEWRPDMLSRILGASQYLEKIFLDHLRAKLERASNLGQLPHSLQDVEPGVRKDVADFVEFQAMQNHLPRETMNNPSTANGRPLWAQVYYCLRCGSPKDAIAVISSSSGQDRSGSNGALMDALEGIEDGRRNPDAEMQVKGMYESLISRNQKDVDPFHAMSLSLICFFHPEVKPSYREKIEVTIEDFIWVGLWFSRAEETALVKLQKKVLKWGERHFDKDGRTPFSFSRVLFLVQEMERGVNYLLQVGLLLEATHLAIALSFCDVLNIDTKNGAPAVDLLKVLQDYTESFQDSDPEKALEYCLQLKHRNEHNLLRVALKKLLAYTSQPEKLVGELQEDGKRTLRGAFDQYFKFEEVQEFLMYAGEEAESTGKSAEAAHLYALGGSYSQCLQVYAQQLGATIAYPNSQRDMWKEKATRFKKYMKVTVTKDQRALSNFSNLLELLDFFELCEAQRYSEALGKIDRLDLLPFNRNDISRKLDSWHEMTEEVRRIFSEIFLKTMECVCKLYTKLKHQSYGSYSSNRAFDAMQVPEQGVTGQKLLEYKERANTLVTFCGLLGGTLPNDTGARMARMEVMMI